jgi:hypothetical protein
MKLTQNRTSRYLEGQKKINNYLLKVSTKNRDALILLSEIRYNLLQGEQKLRDLLNLVSKENINE